MDEMESENTISYIYRNIPTIMRTKIYVKNNAILKRFVINKKKISLKNFRRYTKFQLKTLVTKNIKTNIFLCKEIKKMTCR